MLVDVQLYKGPTLIKESKNLKAIHNKETNCISFMFEGLNKVILEEEKLMFQRSNEEYEFTLHIKEESECNFKLIEQDVTFDIIVDTASYKREENKLIINYKIETNDDELCLIIVKK